MPNTAFANRMEILNLTPERTTKQMWDLGLIELQEVDFNMIKSLSDKPNETMFHIPELRLIKEIVEEYEAETVFIDQNLNRPGVLELLEDMGKLVFLKGVDNLETLNA